MMTGYGLETVEKWARKKMPKDWAQLGPMLTWSPPSANKSLRIDFDADHRVGRITLWEDGSSSAEVISVSDDNVTYDVHFENVDVFRLDEVFADFFAHLKTNDSD
jgi:hypothetical protein